LPYFSNDSNSLSHGTVSGNDLIVVLFKIFVMNYLIAVLPNRIEAEEAYTILEKTGFSQGQIKIVGPGYQKLEDLDLAGKNRSLQMAYWLVPFGFAAGYTFNSLTEFYLFPIAGELGNHLIGGLFGAIAGAMGSFFVGGGALLAGDNEPMIICRDRLQRGKYLVTINAPTDLQKQAREILVRFQPEILNI
jgi:hypothetical protein